MILFIKKSPFKKGSVLGESLPYWYILYLISVNLEMVSGSVIFVNRFIVTPSLLSSPIHLSSD